MSRAFRSAARANSEFLWCVWVLAVAGASSTVGCHRAEPGHATPTPPASVGSLPADLAAKVLAHVGDTTITLGDYETVLDRMDRLDRLRYQTADRRKELLDQIIDVELLAREAERRGLADAPETKELVRQILRAEVLNQLRSTLPKVEDIPAAEVRAYYEAHRADFKEPARRRVADIVVASRATAEKVLAEARAASPKAWGELVRRHSLDKPGPDVPDELAGDLGLVTPPAAGKSDNAHVPEPVRAAVFEIDKPGDVLDRVVEDGNRFYVVRLVAKNEARDRSLPEADRAIRMVLLEWRLHKAEADLERDLRARYPVNVDRAALAKVVVPGVQGKP